MHVQAGGAIFELMGRYFILPSACVVDRPVRITLFNFIARSRSIRGYALLRNFSEITTPLPLACVQLISLFLLKYFIFKILLKYTPKRINRNKFSTTSLEINTR